MLAMGRALMINPRLLLLEEPLEGLAPLIAQDLLHVLRDMVQDCRTAMKLVEQHAQQILPLIRQAMVFEHGRVAWQGTSEALAAQPALLDQFLGVAAH